jgi:hypothetical protein
VNRSKRKTPSNAWSMWHKQHHLVLSINLGHLMRIIRAVAEKIELLFQQLCKIACF